MESTIWGNIYLLTTETYVCFIHRLVVAVNLVVNTSEPVTAMISIQRVIQHPDESRSVVHMLDHRFQEPWSG